MTSSKQDVMRLAGTLGIHVSTWSPGDGATRYRFFVKDDPKGTDYFGGAHALGTCLGAAEAYVWLQGARAAQLAYNMPPFSEAAAANIAASGRY